MSTFVTLTAYNRASKSHMSNAQEFVHFLDIFIHNYAYIIVLVFILYTHTIYIFTLISSSWGLIITEA